MIYIENVCLPIEEDCFDFRRAEDRQGFTQ